MARSELLGVRWDHKGAVGSPYAFTLTDIVITDAEAAAVDWADITSWAVVCYDSAGSAVTAFAPTVTPGATDTVEVSWTAAQATAQGLGHVTYQLTAYVLGSGPLPLVAGTFTLVAPGTPGVATSVSQAFTGYIGSNSASFTAVLGVAPVVGGGGGGANLAYTTGASTGIVTSDSGTDATIPAATGAIAGLLTAANYTKLSGIETAATADMTAAEILAALVTVDGTGSGLDADTLDGTSSAGFATAGHDHSGAYQPLATVLTNTTAAFTTAQETKLSGIETAATADMTAAEILAALLTVDGAGSGLDADLLDGNSSAAFQPIATVLTNTTAAFTTAQETKLSGIATGAIAGIRVEDEGSSTVATATALNFVGSAVTVTDAGSGEATVTITGGGSSDPLDGNAIIAQRIFVR